MAETGLPIVDLSPFMKEVDEDSKKKTVKLISDACTEYGFFQIINHGMPIELMNGALELSKTFFSYSNEEKLKSSPKPDAPLPAGYTKQPEKSRNRNEYFAMFPPDSSFNVYPSSPPGFREIVDDIFSHFVKIGRLIESIINECLGLPQDFLKEYNNDRNWDLLTTFHYFPATEMKNTGVYEHKDMNFLTFVLQDEIGGLEVYKDGKWIPINPIEGALVVNVGDVIQVLSNDKFKSATHKVVTRPGKHRYSYAFAYMLGGEKWVEPLAHLTKEMEVAVPPKYKGFLFSEYIQLRLDNLINPPSKPEDVITISHYAITSAAMK